jgi:uncharacterized protein (DUF983 family)
MTETGSEIEGRPPLWRAALFGLCPKCDAPTLFAGPIAIAENCTACHQDFGNNVGDGPAAFLTMIISALVIALAMTLEFALYPPFWVHVGARRGTREGRLAEDQGDA